eukprot:230715_1
MSDTFNTKNKWKSQIISKHFKNQKNQSTWRHNNFKKRCKKMKRRKSRHNMKQLSFREVTQTQSSAHLQSLYNRHFKMVTSNDCIEQKFRQDVNTLIEKSQHSYPKNSLLLHQLKHEYYRSVSWMECGCCIHDLSQVALSTDLQELEHLLHDNILLQHRTNLKMMLLIEGYMRYIQLPYCFFGHDIVNIIFRFYCYLIKLVFIDLNNKLDFDNYIFIPLDYNYPINAIQVTLENDFPVTINRNEVCKERCWNAEYGKVRLWFKYNSLLSKIHTFPDFDDNKWIRIPPNFTETIQIHDVKTDNFGSNIITILADQHLTKITKEDRQKHGYTFFSGKPRMNVLYCLNGCFKTEYDKMLWRNSFKVDDLIHIRQGYSKWDIAKIEAVNGILRLSYCCQRMSVDIDGYDIYPFNVKESQKVIVGNYVLRKYLSFYEEKGFETTDKPTEYYNFSITNKNKKKYKRGMQRKCVSQLTKKK